MQAPLPHPREPERLAALRRLAVLDTPPDPLLDRIVGLASRLLNMPIALISLVDADRQWFKAKVGLEGSETRRDISFCGHAILGEAPFVVPDAARDPRFADNPLVTGAPDLRFYAGVPLRDPEGLPLGTLCVIDRAPRVLAEDELRVLGDLAAWAARELSLRERLALEAALQASEEKAALYLATIQSGVILIRPDETLGLANPAAAQWLGIRPEDAPGMNWFDHFIPADLRDRGRALFRSMMTGDRPTLGSFEARVLSLDGSERLCRWTHALLRDREGRILGLLSSGEDITELRREEASARALAEFRQAILEGAGTSIIVTDPNGLILAFNRGASQMLGYAAEDVVGRETPAIIHVAEEVVARAESLSHELGRPVPPGFEVFVAKARAGGQETREWTYVRKDGSRFPVTLTVSAIRNAGGDVTAFVGVAIDMTESRQQAEALRLSERRFQEMAERVPGIIYQFQTWPDGRLAFPFISPRVQDLYGVAPEVWHRHPGWPLEQILPEDKPSYLAAFQEALERLATFDWEGRTRTGREGEVLVIHARSSPNLQPDGSVLWEGLLTDLTPIRAREDALRESEARSRALLEALPDRVYRLRRDGMVMDARVPTQVQVFVPPAQLIGHSVYEFLPEEAARRIHAGIERALQTGHMAMAEYQAQVQGSLRDLEGRCVPLSEDEVVAVVRDITERKAMERMRNDFVSTVNHELRTPLTAIRGALGLIRGGLGGTLSDQGAHLLELAHANVERLARLINDILDTEKIQAGQARVAIGPEEALPLLEQAVASMATLAESRGVGFQLTAPDASPRILVDRDRFIQVLVNLLSNAAKFHPAGTPVQVRALPRPGWLRIEVEDRGSGIPDDFRDRIFQKFAQADASTTRAVGGTGLGLAIVKSLTEQMGGLVGFHSEPGRTLFFVEFPTVA